MIKGENGYPSEEIPVKLNKGELKLRGKFNPSTIAALAPRVSRNPARGGPSLAVPRHLNIKGLVLVRRPEMTDLEQLLALDKARKQVKMCCQNYRC